MSADKIEINKIYCADFFEKVKDFSENSFNLIVCDGPYGVTENDWDKMPDIQQYNLKLIKIFSRLLKDGGSVYLFGKPNCLDFIDYRPHLKLNSKIIWYQPSRLAQGRLNFTNNYDVIGYFSKGKSKVFNLNDIRVPQLVELEHRKRCENVPSVLNGKWSKTKFDERGKNPGDVWGDIKQLTYHSKELISRELLNTIQKPKRLIERLVKASTNMGDLVLDPFCGVGTTLEVCLESGRNFIGVEQNQHYVDLTKKRLQKVEEERAATLFS